MYLDDINSGKCPLHGTPCRTLPHRWISVKAHVGSGRSHVCMMQCSHEDCDLHLLLRVQGGRKSWTIEKKYRYLLDWVEPSAVTPLFGSEGRP